MRPILPARKRLLTSVYLVHAAIVWLILCFCGGAASAEDTDRWARLADVAFQHVVRDNDLPNSSAPTTIAQDGKGFIWIGSQDGIARWDGYRFRVYKPDLKQAGSLPDNNIHIVFADKAGTLWIGTGAGGLARYDADADRFVTYAAGPDGLSHVTVTGLEDDGVGGLWIGTDGGLDHLDPRTGKITHLRREDAANAALPDNQIGALLRDRSGNLWVGTAKGLVRRAAGTAGFSPVHLPTLNGDAPFIRHIFEDSRGRIWVATMHHGAFVIDPADGAVQPILETHAQDRSLQTEGINTIAEVRPGEIWLGTYFQGIVVVDTATLRTHRIVHDATLPGSLPDDEVWALLRDRSGITWIGSGRGLSRYAPEQSAISIVFGESSRRDSLSEDAVLSVRAMPDGPVWLGLARKGLDIVDPTGVRTWHLDPDPSHLETALPQKYVWDFALGAHGEVFIATARGLYRSDRTGGHLSRLHVPGQDPTSHIVALLMDQDRLWVGSRDGLWYFNPYNLGRSGLASPFIGPLTDKRVRTLALAPDKTLWVGTENGLNHLDLASGKIEGILPEPANPTGLTGGYIASLLVDGRGRLWVGVSGGGINILTGRDARGRPQFRRLGLDEGLPNLNINKLVADAAGRIWASTDDGISVIDPGTFAVRTLGRAEGLAITTYWVGAGDLTPQGEVLFGGVGGLTIVRPGQFMPWTYDPPVVITDIRVGDTTVAANRFNGSQPQAGERLIVPPGDSLSVEFSALDFSAPERNRYSYRLEGFDKGWVRVDPARRTANYTNLPPGNYTLHLRGSNRNGVWSSHERSLFVRVLPAWYETIWFRLGLGLVGLGAVIAIVQGRTVLLRKRQHELEALIEQRTSELVKSQLQLEQLAYFDVLTDLPNRRLFTDDFRKLLALARREKRGFALLLIDLDRFKQINDTLGHDAGDALLIETANLLRGVLRDSDTLARLGGDEFAILLVEAHDEASINVVCERIVSSFIAPVKFKTDEIKTSPSIGVAIYPQDGDTQESLYKSADLALYAAKAAGRNTWRRYGPTNP